MRIVMSPEAQRLFGRALAAAAETPEQAMKRLDAWIAVLQSGAVQLLSVDLPVGGENSQGPAGNSQQVAREGGVSS